MDRLDGKTALVTGASRGIGAATARLLAARGAAVIVNYVANQKAADEVVAAITTDGGRAMALQADARDEGAVAAMVGEGVAKFGPIDILVLNAGMSVPFKFFVEMTRDEFQTKVMGELDCFWAALKAVVPDMVERRDGCIVGISSTLSRYPAPTFSAHTTAKSAVDGFMKALAMELGVHNIRVNVVAPGLTRTDATAQQPAEQFEMISRMTPLQRVGEPEDIAGVVLSVVSGDFRFVTGAYIPVCGGLLMM